MEHSVGFYIVYIYIYLELDIDCLSAIWWFGVVQTWGIYSGCMATLMGHRWSTCGFVVCSLFGKPNTKSLGFISGMGCTMRARIVKRSAAKVKRTSRMNWPDELIYINGFWRRWIRSGAALFPGHSIWGLIMGAGTYSPRSWNTPLGNAWFLVASRFFWDAQSCEMHKAIGAGGLI